MPAAEFLDLYKQLEQELKTKYAGNDVHYESPVIQFEDSQEGKPFHDELTAIREIRNLLQHTPMIDGQYPVEPSEAAVRSLRNIILSLQHPLKALDFSVRGEQIYKASLDSNLLKTTRVMSERGFSHVPVFQNSTMIGVLSVSCVFDCLVKKGSSFIMPETTVGDLLEYLPFESHPHEFYQFASRDTLYYDVREMFETTYQHSKRLVIVFLTEHGRPTERLLGLLSPWNVLSKKSENP